MHILVECSVQVHVSRQRLQIVQRKVFEVVVALHVQVSSDVRQSGHRHLVEIRIVLDGDRPSDRFQVIGAQVVQVRGALDGECTANFLYVGEGDRAARIAGDGEIAVDRVAVGERVRVTLAADANLAGT